MLEAKPSSLSILGTGHFYPENRIDNRFLQDLDIGTDDAWIIERVGIRSRRTVLSTEYIRESRNVNPLLASKNSLHTNAETASYAIEMALKSTGLKREDIGLVIAGGCSPERFIPAEACTISAIAGIQAPSLDINSACSSFIAAIHFLSSMRTETLPPYVLIVNAENTTRTVNYQDRSNAVLWGDATTAVIVSTREGWPTKSHGPSHFKIKYTCLESDPSGWDKVTITPGFHFTQLGSHVQSFAIKKTLATYQTLAEQARSAADLYFIGHQANLMMLNSVCERAKIPTSRHLYNVDEYGNTGAAGIPGVLSMNRSKFRSGNEIALVAVGSGLTWGGVLLECVEPSTDNSRS